MKVLLAIVSAETSSVGFASSMLNLQAALSTAPGIEAVVEIFPTLQAAVDFAAGADDNFDAVAAIRSRIAFQPGFVLQALVSPSPFIAGVYPLPQIDWKRIASRADDVREDTQFKGNVYNIDASTARPSQTSGYMVVRRAELGAVVLKPVAFRALAGKCHATDEAMCATWGKDIDVDVDRQCSNLGSVEFVGCIGFRSQSAAPGPSSAKISPDKA